MNLDTILLPSRPASGLAQPMSRPSSVLTVPAEAMQTVTPRNVKEWTDYQASMADSAQDDYGVRALEQPPYEHLLSTYTAESQAPAGLGIGQGPMAYKMYNPTLAMNDMSESGQVYSRPTSSDAHPACTMFGFSHSANNELGSPLTWSPDSAHTDTQSSSQHAARTSTAVPISWSNAVSQPSASRNIHDPEMEDNDATVKRYSFNPMQMPGRTCISNESSFDARSSSSSPAPSAVAGSLPMQWRRGPLPFLRSDTPATTQTDSKTTDMPASLQSSSLPHTLLSTVSSFSSCEAGDTPQVTLSPAFHHNDSSSSSSHPWSPQDYLTYSMDASKRSVSPQNALLAPLPVYAGRFYSPGNTLFPDQQHQNAMPSAYRDRHYSNTSSASDPSLSAFREHVHMPYRDSHSPISSSVGSYQSESTDEGDTMPQGGGASWSNGATRSSSSLSFNLESPYAPQSFFNGMQITSPDYIPDRSTSAMSHSSNTQPHLQLPLDPFMTQHLGFQRGSGPHVARRPVAMRHYSHHPYQMAHHQQFIPVPSMYRREHSYSPAINEASRSAPDLSNAALFDTSLYLRTPSPLEQSENWIIPTEDEVRLAALHYQEEKRDRDTNSETQDGRLSYSDAEVDIRMENSEANQKTLSAKRKTRSASKSIHVKQLFDGDQRSASPQQGEASTSVAHPHFSKQSSMSGSTSLPSLNNSSASGQHISSRISFSSAQLSQGLLPLHMLPTKRSRGRRPVVSPELNIDPNLASTTASTVQQVSFTGVTKTGKPKKIFVCRVPGCDKCFRRSEHLKRHIRSIHTHDKPYACAFSTCTKAFARYDNLKQHQKNMHIGWARPASPAPDDDDSAEAASLITSTSPQPERTTSIMT